MLPRNVLFCAVVTALSPWAARLAAEEPKTISVEKFEAIHRLIKPQPGESRWREIAWLTSTWEARKKAAAEGKPIFVWYGGGATPIGAC